MPRQRPHPRRRTGGVKKTSFTRSSVKRGEEEPGRKKEGGLKTSGEVGARKRRRRRRGGAAAEGARRRSGRRIWAAAAAEEEEGGGRRKEEGEGGRRYCRISNSGEGVFSEVSWFCVAGGGGSSKRSVGPSPGLGFRLVLLSIRASMLSATRPYFPWAFLRRRRWICRRCAESLSLASIAARSTPPEWIRER